MKFNGRRALAVTLGILLTPNLLFAVPAMLQPLKGSVSIQRFQKDAWEDVKSPTAIAEGDRIKTDADSLAFMTLPDDHRVAIGPESYLVLQRMAEGETKLYLKNGSVRNKVRRLHLDQGQYYKVQTPSAVCAVRGTDFSMLQNLTARSSEVHVFEGIVDLSGLRKDVSSTVTHLEAGHSATIDPAGTVHPTAPGTTSNPPPTNGTAQTKNDKTTPDKTSDDKGTPKGPHRPPPPGAGPGGPPAMPGTGDKGPVWYNDPGSINTGTFKYDPGSPGAGPDEGSRPPQANKPTDPAHPTNGPDGGLTAGGYNPTSGTGYGNPTGGGFSNPGNPTGISGGPPNVYNPPPTGSNPTGDGGTTTPTDPVAAGNQALFDTIRASSFKDQLQGLLVAGLFQDGSVKLSPIDGQYHLYADAVQQNGSDGVKFLNATMAFGHPNTMNYQVATIKFNQALPANSSAYTVATQTAFRGDVAPATGGGPPVPSYYAAEIDNYRSNTVDYVDVQASGGHLVLDTAANRYVTAFNTGKTEVNGTVLWQTSNSGGTTYLGGAHPTINLTTSGGANTGMSNVYTTATGNVVFGRQVVYFNDSGQIANTATIPSGVSAQQYFAGQYLTVQDTLFSNLFHNGPILAFGSAQSRVLGGIDSILTNQDAGEILNGKMVVGMPDGLVRM